MRRRAVTAASCVAWRRTSSKVSRLNGPISPGRWQETHRDQMIGAMSLVKVRRGCAATGDAISTKRPARPRRPNRGARGDRRESLSLRSLRLTARGESLASHRDGRGAPMARRDDREYREYLSEEQRSQRGPQRGSRVGVERGCIARRMQPDFRRELLGGRDPDRLRRVKAVLCKAYGPPESLVVEDVASPEPGPGDVVITVKAASVNFPDVLIIQNKYQVKPPLPFSPGSEVAGIVKSVGEGVTGVKAGDRVMAFTTFGAFAEEVKTDARRLTPLPDGMDFNTAA